MTRRLPPLTQTFLILTLGACGMATLLALLPAAGHDQMWLLYAARLMLHGAQPYGPQIFETNPPLILWLSAIPAYLAPILHLPDTALGKLLVLLLEAAMAALCLKIWVPHPLRFHRKGWGIEPTARPSSPTTILGAPRLEPETWDSSTPTPYILLFAYITAVAVLPARDFGQRDHLLTLFLLPYLAAAARRLANLPIPTPLAYLTGTLALLGLALKPHQLLIPFAVELLLISTNLRVPHLRRGLIATEVGSQSSYLATLLRPEPQTLLLTGLLFLLAVHHFTPLYFTSVVPLARDTYWAYGSLSPLQLLTQSIQLHILLLLNLALLFTRTGRHPAPLTRILLSAGLAATLAFYLQGTGWYYQQLPALTFLTLALTLQLLAIYNKTPRAPCLDSETWVYPSPNSPGAPSQTVLPSEVGSYNPGVPRLDSDNLYPLAAALTLLALALTTHFMNYPFTPARSFPIDQPDPTFFTSLPPGSPVLTLSPTIDDTLQPIYKFHLTLAQRYPAFVLLPALLRSEMPKHSGAPGSGGLIADPGVTPSPTASHHILPTRLADLDRLQHTMMVEDLLRWHPVLILVERCQDPAVHCQVLEDRHDDLLAFFLRDPAFRTIFAHYRFQRTSGQYDAYTLNP